MLVRHSLFLLALMGCPKAVPPNLVPDDVAAYKTADGWVNALRHYPGEGPPVMLVHGMSANHNNWDFRDDASFVPRLLEEGYDVWVPELRGDPGSRHTSRRAGRRFTFDDHARYDLPAAVDRVLEITGESDLLWVGHSMGGMLLYTAISHYPDKVRAGVAVSAPAQFLHPIKIHKLAKGAGWLIGGHGMLPTRGLGMLALNLGLRRMLEHRVAAPDTLRSDLVRGLAKHTLQPIPKAMARQTLEWLREGELATLQGEPWLTTSLVPLLVMAGPADGIVSEPDVAAACDRFSDCRYVQLSEAWGFSHDYGHIDTVLGRTAPIEVLPLILDFLEEHAHGGEAGAGVPSGAADTDLSAR